MPSGVRFQSIGFFTFLLTPHLSVCSKFTDILCSQEKETDIYKKGKVKFKKKKTHAHTRTGVVDGWCWLIEGLNGLGEGGTH